MAIAYSKIYLASGYEISLAGPQGQVVIRAGSNDQQRFSTFKRAWSHRVDNSDFGLKYVLSRECNWNNNCNFCHFRVAVIWSDGGV